MKFEIVTIFPDFFRGPLDYGIVRRAREAGLIEIRMHDLRAFTTDRHKTVDDRPFGGGEGMVLKPEPLFGCIESLGVAAREQRLAGEAEDTVILLSPQGRMFTQAVAAELARLERVVLICGRYEGVDERVTVGLADREVSIGDYVLSGGELGAAVILDTITRLIPGALGNEASAVQESFSAAPNLASSGALNTVPGGASASMQGGASSPVPSGKSKPGTNAPDSTCSSGGLLDYPHYTRPAEFRGMQVPEVLMGGNHEQIRKWRRRKALEKTFRNRPDLLERQELNEEDKRLLAEIENRQ
jgi:tRNA (guanine37-N1)-methyltransferase